MILGPSDDTAKKNAFNYFENHSACEKSALDIEHVSHCLYVSCLKHVSLR
jgi:hypothetical protein